MRRMTLVFTALLLALSACSSTSQPGPTIGSGGASGGGATGGLVGNAGKVHLVQGALVRFQACEDFLAHVKAEAIERVGPYGLEWYGGYPWPVMMRGELAVDELAAPVSLNNGAGGDFSTTNNQEIGVDEADIVKTDGHRIVTIVNGTLTIVDVTGDEPEILGMLRLAPELAVRDLFLYGDTVVLIGNTWGHMPGMPARAVPEAISSDAFGVVAPDYYGSPVVTLTEVDISEDPAIIRTLQIDGSYLSSRMIDGVARVVTSSGPTGFVWAYPEGGGLKAERAAVEANRRIIEDSTIENWVPYYVLSDSGGEVIREGTALPCSRAHHPEEFAGFNMLSVMTIDLATGLDILDSTGVLASGETLYSSANAMYVATNEWFDPRVFDSPDGDAAAAFAGGRTQIHQFDITSRTTEYVATGSVPGYLLNQFAMSEHNGDLRVASTTTPNWWGLTDGSEESIVSVLRPRDGELELIGSVAGLGKDERIYSVRFLGDVGYVVTFRQIDPLFTIDLSDPSSPEVRGELKIPGYSAYLHPLTDTLLLGIGQDATSEGRVEGSQVSLFDVSDLDNPERIAKLNLGKNSNSTAEYDHRAFLQWGDTVVVPLTEYDWENGKDSFFTGAVAIDTSGRDLREITRIVHPDGENRDAGWNATILRSVVVDGNLYTISNLGIMQNELDGFESSVWVRFPV